MKNNRGEEIDEAAQCYVENLDFKIEREANTHLPFDISKLLVHAFSLGAQWADKKAINGWRKFDNGIYTIPFDERCLFMLEGDVIEIGNSNDAALKSKAIAWMTIPELDRQKRKQVGYGIVKELHEVIPHYIRHELHCPLCGASMVRFTPEYKPPCSTPYPHKCSKCGYEQLYGITRDYPYIETVYENVSKDNTNKE